MDCTDKEEEDDDFSGPDCWSLLPEKSNPKSFKAKNWPDRSHQPPRRPPPMGGPNSSVFYKADGSFSIVTNTLRNARPDSSMRRDHNFGT